MAKKATIAGNTFLFTGKLTEFTREDAEAHVEAEGGKVLSGVSAKLNYLVVGEDAGSKLAKAKALGTVTILHEKEFLKMMSSGKKTPTKAATKKIVKATAKATPKKIAKSTAKVNSVSKQDSTKTAIDEIKIGKQIWCVKNLDVANFRNGDSIPEAKTDKDWVKAGKKKQPAWCYYDNDSKNGKKYGKLYNWFAVNDPRNIAPDGWSVPSAKDWKKLEKFLGDVIVGYILKSIKGWLNSSPIPHDGIQVSNFNGLPGGVRYSSGNFTGLGDHVAYWSSDLRKDGDVTIRYLQYDSDYLGEGSDSITDGYYIRCIKF